MKRRPGWDLNPRSQRDRMSAVLLVIDAPVVRSNLSRGPVGSGSALRNTRLCDPGLLGEN